MAREPLAGVVRDIKTGNVIGEADDIEAVFLGQVERVHAEGDCYVVVGSDPPDGFIAKLQELGVPVVRDDSFGESAAILDGRPEEWEDVLERSP